MRQIEFVVDIWTDEKRSMCITNEEAEIFYNLNADDIYYHLRKSIGKVTPLGADKFVPRYKIGDLSISVQYHYYLWSKRIDESLSYGKEDNSPVTEDEFLRIVGDNANSRKLLDVMVEFKGVQIIKPTQSTLRDLVFDLHDMVND